MTKNPKTIIRRFKTLLQTEWYKIPHYTTKRLRTSFMSLLDVFTPLLLSSLVFISCSSTKNVPINTNTQVIVRDSIIHLVDTIKIEVPKEIVRQTVPQDTISILKTSLAQSIAKIEDGRLNHELRQQGTVNAKIDTCYLTKIEKQITYQEVPVEVIREVRHIPDWVSYSLMLNIALILLLGIKLYLKVKSLKL